MVGREEELISDLSRIISRHIKFCSPLVETKDRQRWRAEEDALLCAYVKQYGAREWNLVSHRMNTPLNRDAKSCLERWNNCCRELEEGHRAWAAHRKEAAWRLRRVELQLESEKACRRREKMEEIESKIKALREEQNTALDRIEAEYREQLEGLRGDAEAKEQKLTEQWASKHVHLTKFLEQMGCRPRVAEPNGR
ncbi:hypothetical protein GQ457_06G007410 [Hibiscus cannabinus]